MNCVHALIRSLCPSRTIEILSPDLSIKISTSRLYFVLGLLIRFHDNSSTDISSTTLRLQTFRLLLYTSVRDSYTSNFCFSISLFSSIPTSTYIRIPFYLSHFH